MERRRNSARPPWVFRTETAASTYVQLSRGEPDDLGNASGRIGSIVLRPGHGAVRVGDVHLGFSLASDGSITYDSVSTDADRIVVNRFAIAEAVGQHARTIELLFKAMRQRVPMFERVRGHAYGAAPMAAT